MTWRVGVLFSQTGVTAAIERSQLNGTLLAVDEINKAGGVLGRPIEPNIYDPASNPKQFRALAERLLTADRRPRGGPRRPQHGRTSPAPARTR